MTTAIETTIVTKTEHQIPGALLQKKVQITVVGCGGTGSAIAAGLPYLHQAMVGLGHPYGLDVTWSTGTAFRAPTASANLSVRAKSDCTRRQYSPPGSICFGAWDGKECRTSLMKVGGTRPTF